MESTSPKRCPKGGFERLFLAVGGFQASTLRVTGKAAQGAGGNGCPKDVTGGGSGDRQCQSCLFISNINASTLEEARQNPGCQQEHPPSS